VPGGYLIISVESQSHTVLYYYVTMVKEWKQVRGEHKKGGKHS